MNDQSFDLEKIIDAFGNIPGKMIDYGAKALKPVENYIGSYLTLWDNLGDPRVVEAWHAMNTWVTDLIPMTGATYRQLIKELYRENRLIEGRWTLRGEQVDLSRIRASLLNVIALADHISPALSIGEHHAEGQQPGSALAEGEGRTYRHDGGKCCVEAYMATH